MKMILKRRKKKEVKETPLQDKVAGKIAGGLIKVQTKFSNGMNKIVSTMTTKKVKIWLAVFCIVSGGLSVYFFVNAIVTKPKSVFKIDNVHVPEHFDKSGDEIMENPVSVEMYQQIQEYKRYMDSLGEPIRPSLLDSIKILEEIYLQQQK